MTANTIFTAGAQNRRMRRILWLGLALVTGCSEPRPAPWTAEAPPYCTRSLGVVDCWKDPKALPGPIPRQMQDGWRPPPAAPITY
jgi:hypothetical protein